MATNKNDLNSFENLVFGLGETGMSIARYFNRKKINAIYIDTRREPPNLSEIKECDPNAKFFFGDIPLDILDNVRRIIVSPGLVLDHPILNKAVELGINIVSDIDLFIESSQAEVIAITGSNGKSTVTTLLGLMCNHSGKKVLTGANLGCPALDLLVQDQPEYYILELSSFHLHKTKYLPTRVSVVLNLSADHLDWHNTEKHYFEAKYRVYSKAKMAVYNRSLPDSLNYFHENIPSLSFGSEIPEKGHYGVLIKDGSKFLVKGEDALIKTSEIGLVGDHNYLNALAALAIGDMIGLDQSSMLDALRKFTGLPHRMQLVGNFNSVDYINDSKGTNVGAVIASVQSMTGPVILIAGGQGKGANFKYLAESIHKEIKSIIIFGQDAPLIAKEFENLVTLYLANDLKQAVIKARDIAIKGDSVLLSPACASFDQFDNYMHRGDVFSSVVKTLMT